jgi:hypothetical protein
MRNRRHYTGAFVVQFEPGAQPEADSFRGRVEHVASGRTAQFRVPEELLAFLTKVLAEEAAPRPEES